MSEIKKQNLSRIQNFIQISLYFASADTFDCWFPLNENTQTDDREEIRCDCSIFWTHPILANYCAKIYCDNLLENQQQIAFCSLFHFIHSFVQSFVHKNCRHIFDERTHIHWKLRKQNNIPMNSVEMQSTIEYVCSAFVFVIQFHFAFQSSLPTLVEHNNDSFLYIKMWRVDSWYQFFNVFRFFCQLSLALPLLHTHTRKRM